MEKYIIENEAQAVVEPIDLDPHRDPLSVRNNQSVRNSWCPSVAPLQNFVGESEAGGQLVLRDSSETSEATLPEMQKPFLPLYRVVQQHAPTDIGSNNAMKNRRMSSDLS